MITSINNRKIYLLDTGEYPHFIHVLLLAIGNPSNPDNWEALIVKTTLTSSVQPDDQNSSRLWRMSSSCWHEIYPYQKVTGRSLAHGEVISISPRGLMKMLLVIGCMNINWFFFYKLKVKWKSILPIVTQEIFPFDTDWTCF